MSSQMGEGAPDSQPRQTNRGEQERFAHSEDQSAGVGARRPDNRDHDLEREEFGGIKWGAAFFGWLTAAGAAVLLASLVAAVGALVDRTTSTDLQALSQDPQSAGIVGGIVLLVVLLIAYFCGGYVAGRMARFDGARQGVAVWLWTIIMTVLVSVLGYFAGEEFNLAAQVGALPSLPIEESQRTLGAIIAVAAVLLTALIGAVLGGIAGMRFHRKVDAAGRNI